MNQRVFASFVETRASKRLLIFGLAIAGGYLAGSAWDTSLSNRAYFGFLEQFLNPQAQIANLSLGVALAFLVGFIHVVSV